MQTYEVFYSTPTSGKSFQMIVIKAEDAWTACNQAKEQVPEATIQYIHPVMESL